MEPREPRPATKPDLTRQRKGEVKSVRRGLRCRGQWACPLVWKTRKASGEPWRRRVPFSQKPFRSTNLARKVRVVLDERRGFYSAHRTLRSWPPTWTACFHKRLKWAPRCGTIGGAGSRGSSRRYRYLAGLTVTTTTRGGKEKRVPSFPGHREEQFHDV